MKKPMLATDYVESKLKFPLMAQPKIDGVRGINFFGNLTGRSLKSHANKHTTSFYSRSVLAGLDGELAAESECHPDLCRLTTSALSTQAGEPYTLWWLFDYVTPDTVQLPYLRRYELLLQRHAEISQLDLEVWQHLRVVPSYMCQNLEQLLALDDMWLSQGYEGTIIRDPEGMYKNGRSTVKEGGLLRIKRFVESEAIVIGIVEGETNLNEAQVNELGRTFRTSHQENKIPNGMIGSLLCKQIGDVTDAATGQVILEDGQDITVSPGAMTEEEKKFYFENKGLIMGKMIKYKFFPKGIKDKPRFPNFQSFRMGSDV